MHKLILFVAALALSPIAPAQIGGSGKLGAFIPARDTTLNTAFNGGVFEFTEIKITKGVTLTLIGPNPAILKATGDIRIDGAIDVDGIDNTNNSSSTSGTRGGAGGWAGGNSGSPGLGPGGGDGCSSSSQWGGSAGHRTVGHYLSCSKTGSRAYGADDPLDLRGGSGGGGAGAGFRPGGCGGGGTVALLSNGRITVSGSISANGGTLAGSSAGHGSGGVIALRAILGVNLSGGRLSARGGGTNDRGADGFIRIDSGGGAPVLGSISPTPKLMSLPDLGQIGTAKLGGSFKMRVVSTPNDPVVLAVAGRGANIPMGSMGCLKIDPAAMVLAGSGKASTSDFDSRIDFTIQVPNNSKLLGLPLFWQAMVSVSYTGRPQLTNVLITSIL
jgi:hypothetical protein